VVDQDRQVVFGFFMFNHRGDVLWVNTPGEGNDGEAFRIKNGLIRKVEALMTALPYGAKWSGCSVMGQPVRAPVTLSGRIHRIRGAR
jgi:hypothetical protein